MTDEDKTIFQALYVFVFFALAASILSFIAPLVLAPGPLTADSLGGMVGTITCLVILWFLRIKKLTLPRFIIPSVVYLLATYFIFTGDVVGIRDDSIFIYALTVAVAGLLLGNRGVIIFGLLSLLAVESSVYAEINGLIVNHISVKNTTYATFVTVGATYTSAFLMMYILVSILTRNIAKMRINQHALAQANEELKNIRASLEIEVKERTAIAQASQREAESAWSTAEIQIWLVTGQAQLAEKMRGDLDSTTLANNIVRHICRYTGAQAGVFFLVDGESLHLLGRYAYSAPTTAKTTIQMGEGMVGQAARERSQLILHKIPVDTLQIASGLGETTPRQILIAPLETAGKVIGVLELATLTEFTDAHQTFIALSAESIAVAFQTAKARERIASLLLESQRQAEALLAQEEELRNRNERLQMQAENRDAIQLAVHQQGSQS